MDELGANGSASRHLDVSDDESSQRHIGSVIPLKLPVSKSTKIQLKRTSTPFKLFRRRSTEKSVNSGLSSMTSRSYLFDEGDSQERSGDETRSTNSEVSSTSESYSNSERPWNERVPVKSSMKVTWQKDSLNRTFPSTSALGLFEEPTCNFTSWITKMLSSSSDDCCGKKESVQKSSKVVFTNVKINYHRTILGTRVHNSLALLKDERGEGGDEIGPTLALGDWACSESMSIEEMQEIKLGTEAKRDKTLRLSIEERRRILKTAGVSKRDISRCEQVIAKEKRALSKEKRPKGEGGHRKVAEKLKSMPFFRQQSQERLPVRDRMRL